MQLFVRTINNELFTLDVDVNESCFSLRDQIFEKLGYDMEECSLFCDGKYLNQNISIEELGIGQESIIRCDPILAGGAKKRKKKNYSTPKRIKHKRKKTALLTLKRYTVQKDGSVVGKLKACKECGPGIFMGDHKNRLYCGRCHDTQMKA